jgi:hypothetical protein
MPKSFILSILFDSQSWKLEVWHHAQHPCKEGRKELCVSAKTKQQDFILVFITFAMAGSLQQLFAAATNTAIASSA